MLIVFASPFRILVTFAIVLEVHGISFFQIPRTILAEVCWIKRSQQECPRWVLHAILWLCQFYLSAWVIRKKYVELVRHTNPWIHNSKCYMLLELSILSCIPTIIYKLIVRNSCAFVFIDAYYSCGPSSHSISEWLGETNSSTSSISRIGSK